MKRRVLVTGLVILTCMPIALAGVRQLARSRSTQLFGRLVARVDVAEPVLALTFDDGPTLTTLDEILETLAARNVRATFFVNGKELAAEPGAGQRLVAAGHELGNHTYSHQRMIFKSPKFVREEVERTDALIRAAGHKGEIYFRPPFGWKLVGLPWFLQTTGRTSVTWDLEPDSFPEVAASPASIVVHVVERARPGSIILLHIWHQSRRTSLTAVPMVIDALSAKGYRFVTVGDLLAMASVQQSSRGR